MNKIEKIRHQIKNGLESLSEGNQHMFRLMYSPYDLKCPITIVVDNMPEKQLKGALAQVERTVVMRYGGPKCQLE